MSRRKCPGWHRYEYGRATVMVKRPTTALIDGLVPMVFRVKVHPVSGPTMETDVRAFYAWDAANRALNLYQELREDAK